jgi:hypothetical protein
MVATHMSMLVSLPMEFSSLGASPRGQILTRVEMIGEAANRQKDLKSPVNQCALLSRHSQHHEAAVLIIII